MASQHSLELIATLNTDQVQQQLQQLRSQQERLNAPANNGGYSSNFSRLEASVGNLQRSIDTLNRSMSKFFTQMRSPQAFVSRGLTGHTISNSSSSPSYAGAFGLAAASGISIGNSLGNIVQQMNAAYTKAATQAMSQYFQKRSWFGSSAYQMMNDAVNKAMIKNPEQFMIEGGLHGFNASNKAMLAHNVMTVPGVNVKGLGLNFTPAQYATAMQNWQAANAANIANPPMNFIQPKTRYGKGGFQSRAARGLALYIGGHMLTGIGSELEYYGHTTAGTIVNAAGEGIQTGTQAAWATSQLAGPKVGAAVGIIATTVSYISALNKGFDKLQQQSINLAKSFAQAREKAYEHAYHLNYEKNAFFEGLEVDRIGRSKKVTGEMLLKEQEWASIAEKYKEAYSKMEDPQVQAQRVLTRVAAESKGITDEKKLKDIREKGLKEIENYQKQFQLTAQNAKYAYGIYQSYHSIAQNLRDKEKEEYERAQEEEKLRFTAAQYEAFDIADKAKENDIIRREKLFARGIIDPSSKLSGKSQFEALSEKLDEMRASRAESMRYVFDLNKEIAAGGQSADRLEELGRMRDEELSNANLFAARAAVLENALSKIAVITNTPDFSHVQSLAGHGFYMGENSNTTDRAMERYYSEMTNLTKQIKNKLDEGLTTEATYE